MRLTAVSGPVFAHLVMRQTGFEPAKGLTHKLLKLAHLATLLLPQE